MEFSYNENNPILPEMLQMYLDESIKLNESLLQSTLSNSIETRQISSNRIHHSGQHRHDNSLVKSDIEISRLNSCIKQLNNELDQVKTELENKSKMVSNLNLRLNKNIALKSTIPKSSKQLLSTGVQTTIPSGRKPATQSVLSSDSICGSDIPIPYYSDAICMTDEDCLKDKETLETAIRLECAQHWEEERNSLLEEFSNEILGFRDDQKKAREELLKENSGLKLKITDLENSISLSQKRIDSWDSNHAQQETILDCYRAEIDSLREAVTRTEREKEKLRDELESESDLRVAKEREKHISSMRAIEERVNERVKSAVLTLEGRLQRSDALVHQLRQDKRHLEEQTEAFNRQQLAILKSQSDEEVQRLRNVHAREMEDIRKELEVRLSAKSAEINSNSIDTTKVISNNISAVSLSNMNAEHLANVDKSHYQVRESLEAKIRILDIELTDTKAELRTVKAQHSNDISRMQCEAAEELERQKDSLRANEKRLKDDHAAVVRQVKLEMEEEKARESKRLLDQIHNLRLSLSKSVDEARVDKELSLKVYEEQYRQETRVLRENHQKSLARMEEQLASLTKDAENRFQTGLEDSRSKISRLEKERWLLQSKVDDLTSMQDKIDKAREWELKMSSNREIACSTHDLINARDNFIQTDPTSSHLTQSFELGCQVNFEDTNNENKSFSKDLEVAPRGRIAWTQTLIHGDNFPEEIVAINEHLQDIDVLSDFSSSQYTYLTLNESEIMNLTISSNSTSSNDNKSIFHNLTEDATNTTKSILPAAGNNTEHDDDLHFNSNIQFASSHRQQLVKRVPPTNKANNIKLNNSAKEFTSKKFDITQEKVQINDSIPHLNLTSRNSNFKDNGITGSHNGSQLLSEGKPSQSQSQMIVSSYPSSYIDYSSSTTPRKLKKFQIPEESPVLSLLRWDENGKKNNNHAEEFEMSASVTETFEDDIPPSPYTKNKTHTQLEERNLTSFSPSLIKGIALTSSKIHNRFPFNFNSEMVQHKHDEYSFEEDIKKEIELPNKKTFPKNPSAFETHEAIQAQQFMSSPSASSKYYSTSNKLSARSSSSSSIVDVSNPQHIQRLVNSVRSAYSHSNTNNTFSNENANKSNYIDDISLSQKKLLSKPTLSSSSSSGRTHLSISNSIQQQQKQKQQQPSDFIQQKKELNSTGTRLRFSHYSPPPSVDYEPAVPLTPDREHDERRKIYDLNSKRIDGEIARENTNIRPHLPYHSIIGQVNKNKSVKSDENEVIHYEEGSKLKVGNHRVTEKDFFSMRSIIRERNLNSAFDSSL